MIMREGLCSRTYDQIEFVQLLLEQMYRLLSGGGSCTLYMHNIDKKVLVAYHAIYLILCPINSK